MKTLVTAVLVLALCQTCVSQGEEEQFTGLRIATDPTIPPFEFRQEDGTIIGFDIDFLNSVTQTAGFSYELVSASWTDMFEMVKNNQVDLAVAEITINDDRKEIYDFSVPYFLSTYKILALEGTDIQSAQDLVGKVVAVKNGTTGAASVEKIYGGDNPNIKRYQTLDEGVQAVANGEADAYVDDSPLIEYFAKNNPGFVVITDPNAFEYQMYGFMFPKGSALVAPFNEVITTVLQNGGYTTIYESWFGTTPDVALLLRAGTLQDPYDALEESFGEEEMGLGSEEFVVEVSMDWTGTL